LNILLTGGAGYIGSHAAVVFGGAGHQIVVIDNFCNSDRSVLSGIEKILGQKVPFIDGDVRDTQLLEKTFKHYKIDAVIHFAGLKAVGESALNPIEYATNNVQGAISLLQAMHKCNIKRLVFSSSATVYGDPHYLPIDENHMTSAVSPYGRNKLHIEEMLRDVASSDESWRMISLRYFNPVGAHESGLIGENPNGVPNNLVPFIAMVAAGNLPCLNIYGDDYPTPDGTGIRDYIHVMDLVEGHLAALEYIDQHSGYQFINLGTGIGTSVFEMVKAYELASSCRINYKIAPRRLGDIASCYASIHKAEALLGWTSKMGLSDMCESSWRWYQNQKNIS
jgi:UDP-glucose 4-epimerase